MAHCGDSVLFDSGGAPLSTTALNLFRERHGDLREGYGLTETASLTHFDTEGSERSIGTVGGPMPNVKVRFTHKQSTTRLELSSPNAGRRLLVSGEVMPPGDWLNTGDNAIIDQEGRLRILGRSDDARIQGLWPRDTLDAIGPILGSRCALVQHPSESSVQISLLSDLSVDEQGRLLKAVSNIFCTDRLNVAVRGRTSIIASRKLARQPMSDGQQES